MLQHTIVGGMCYGLIAAHKVESMCGTAHRNAAFGAQQQQQHWRVSKQQLASSQHFTHFSTRNFSLPHQASLPVDYLEHSGSGEGSHLGSENIWVRVNSRQLQLLQEALLNISHISHRGISGSHQASLPVLVLG